jgi:tetratricopeptide (TPR) repeat protein
MSYIHEALKKAQKDKEVLAGKCSRILSQHRFGNVFSKGEWLVPVCVIAAAFAFSSFSWFFSMGELASNKPNQSMIQHQQTLARDSLVKEQPIVRKSPVIAGPNETTKSPIMARSPIVGEKTVVPHEDVTEGASPAIPGILNDPLMNKKEQIASSAALNQPNKLSEPSEEKPTEVPSLSASVPPSTDLLKPEKSPLLPHTNSESESIQRENLDKNLSDQNVSETLYNQALDFQKKGRLEEAKNLYEATLKQTPNLVTALNNLGAVYVQLNNLEEARKVLEKAIRISPQFADAYYNLACLHARRKDLARGMFYLKKSISMNPVAREWARTDEDLKDLREHSEYEEMLRNDVQS